MGQYNSRHVIKHVTLKFASILPVEIEASLRISTRVITIDAEQQTTGKPNFIAFVDLKKAFDTVSWPKLFDILTNKGVKYKDRRIISFLYRDQKAVVEMQGKRGGARIRKGVRQGYSLSPPLFNLYSKETRAGQPLMDEVSG